MSTPISERIPVLLLTGFLGSGKTTLLRQLLAQTAMADSAVLINELGAQGLDHQLAWGSTGNTGSTSSATLLANGCVCCTVRDDLLAVMEDLYWARLQRRMPRFVRLVIETTGLADPLPIIEGLQQPGLVSERYVLQAVLCTADATQGLDQLQRHPESLSQAALADVLLLTKTDLLPAHQADALLDALQQRLQRINPAAALRACVRGELPAQWLLDLGLIEAATHDPQRARAHLRLVRDEHARSRADSSQMPDLFDHSDGSPARIGVVGHSRVHCFCLRFPLSLPEDVARGALQQLLSEIPALRIKGLLRLRPSLHREQGPDQPATTCVVQAAGDQLYDFEPLPDALREEEAGYLVFITRSTRQATGTQAAVLAALRRHALGATALSTPR